MLEAQPEGGKKQGGDKQQHRENLERDRWQNKAGEVSRELRRLKKLGQRKAKAEQKGQQRPTP